MLGSRRRQESTCNRPSIGVPIHLQEPPAARAPALCQEPTDPSVHAGVISCLRAARKEGNGSRRSAAAFLSPFPGSRGRKTAPRGEHPGGPGTSFPPDLLTLRDQASKEAGLPRACALFYLLSPRICGQKIRPNFARKWPRPPLLYRCLRCQIFENLRPMLIALSSRLSARGTCCAPMALTFGWGPSDVSRLAPRLGPPGDLSPLRTKLPSKNRRYPLPEKGLDAFRSASFVTKNRSSPPGQNRKHPQRVATYDRRGQSHAARATRLGGDPSVRWRWPCIPHADSPPGHWPVFRTHQSGIISY